MKALLQTCDSEWLPGSSCMHMECLHILQRLSENFKLHIFPVTALNLVVNKDCCKMHDCWCEFSVLVL